MLKGLSQKSWEVIASRRRSNEPKSCFRDSPLFYTTRKNIYCRMPAAIKPAMVTPVKLSPAITPEATGIV